MSIDVGACAAPATIVINTRASVYELVVLHGEMGDVLVRGGSQFAEFRRVFFVGSIGDGGLLVPRTIDIGLRMRFLYGDRIVTTSAVRSLSRRPAATTSGPLGSAPVVRCDPPPATEDDD